MKTDFKNKIVIPILSLGAAAFIGTTVHAQNIDHTQKAGPGIYEIVFNESNHDVYVAAAGSRNTSNGFIYVFDGESMVKKDSIDVQSAPAYGLGFNQTTQTLYSSNTRSNSVHAIDVTTGNIIATITPDKENSHTRELVIDEENNLIYVSDFGTPGSIWVINGKTNTLDRIIENTGEGSTGMALNTDENLLYITNMSGNEIAVLNLETDQIVNTYPAHGERPTNADYDPATGRLFIANQGTANMTVLDASSGELLATVETGEGALGIRFDKTRNRVFIANRGAGTVSVIDGDSYEVLANLKTGTHPNTVAINPESGAAFVTNKAGRTEDGSPDVNGDTVTKIAP